MWLRRYYDIYIKRLHVRPIHGPAPRLPWSTSDLPRSNPSNPCTTRVRFEQLLLDQSIPCYTYLHADPQHESAINLVTYRSSIWICGQPVVNLFTRRSSTKIRDCSCHSWIFNLNLRSTYSHEDPQQKSAIDLVTHKSSIRIYGQLVHTQILYKNLRMIWSLIELPSKSAINLFTHRSFTRIRDLSDHSRIFSNDLWWPLKNDWSRKRSKLAR